MGDGAVRHRSGDRRPHRRGSQAQPRTPGSSSASSSAAAISSAAWPAAAKGMDRDQRRLHGHAGDGDERAGHAERARADRRRDPRAVGDPDEHASASPIIRRRAVRHMEKGRIVIFAAGTGNPYLHHRHRRGAARRRNGLRRAVQGHQRRRRLRCRSQEGPDAKRYETVSFNRVLGDDLKVMDACAVALCRDNDIPIVVFSIREQGNLARGAGGRGRSRRSFSNEGELNAWPSI